MARALLARKWLVSRTTHMCTGPWCAVRCCVIKQISHRSYSTRTSCYDMLEVTPKATQAQIKAAYYRLSKKFHPDVNKSEDAAAKFTAISEAYEILGHQKNRQQYDRGLGSPSAPSAGQSAGPEAYYDQYTRTFRKRTGPVYGKTKEYDFDEFYRQHYGDSMNRQYKDRVRYEDFLKEEKEQLKRDRVSLFVAGMGLVVMTLSMIFGGRIRKPPGRKF